MESVTEILGDYRGISVFCWGMQSVDAFSIIVLLWCQSLDMFCPRWACAGNSKSSQLMTCLSHEAVLGLKFSSSDQ